MDDDYIDDEGTIWIWKVMGGLCDAARPADPSTRKTRWKLGEHRLAQLHREAAHNIEIIKAAQRTRPDH